MIAAFISVTNEAGSSAHELGEDRCILRREMVILEWEKNKYSKEVYLESLGNSKWPLQIWGG